MPALCFFKIVASLAALTLLVGCSTNAATGRSQFTGLMSENQEIQIGKQAHQSILKQYGGVYEDADLSEYIATLGARLALASERKNLPWQFTVLDTPTINAFALPGGKLYITRGLLALFQDEAELAAVLGHEVGHVTARHALERQNSQLLASIFVAGVGIATESSQAAELANMASGYTILSYSRDQEHEADMLGIR